MKIAFLEDDSDFADKVVSWLEQDGHQVTWFSKPHECLRTLANDRFDMCLFDHGLPNMSGADVMTSLNLKGVLPPLIFLTAMDSEEDVVKILNEGADDYIIKPPTKQMLLARINALGRRIQAQKPVETIFQYGHLTVDFGNRRFEIDGKQVSLTEKETELAMYFFGRIGVLLSRAHLIQVVWASNADVDTRTVDVHVSHLRSKLKLVPDFGWRLTSVYHQGYRLEQVE